MTSSDNPKRQTHYWKEGTGLESLASSEAREVTCWERGHKVWKRERAELEGLVEEERAVKIALRENQRVAKARRAPENDLWVYVQPGLLYAVLTDDAEYPWVWAVGSEGLALRNRALCAVFHDGTLQLPIRS